MYKLHIFPKAKRELKKISIRHQKAILELLKDLEENPFLGKPLTRELTGKFSYKVGSYRIIYAVRKKDKIVEIFTAGHRATIYK
ncbi:MAG: type II toxin-antitoxin system RelE/ParE family toxin [Candidatus Levybacteria bacterium]|nr:type II toxin-antitoxin system RelE/ParE family toxin [Candidatus Levybacteria bacterium]